MIGEFRAFGNFSLFKGSHFTLELIPQCVPSGMHRIGERLWQSVVSVHYMTESFYRVSRLLVKVKLLQFKHCAVFSASDQIIVRCYHVTEVTVGV